MNVFRKLLKVILNCLYWSINERKGHKGQPDNINE